MGIIDAIGKALDVAQPIRPAARELEAALPPAAAAPAPAQPNPNAAQNAYQARQDAMNSKNPYYKNVDNPVTIEPLKVKGNP